MNAFKKYAKSTRECLRPNPVKIKTYMGLRIKNRAYSISKNPTKATDYLIGLEDLACMLLRVYSIQYCTYSAYMIISLP